MRLKTNRPAVALVVVVLLAAAGAVSVDAQEWNITVLGNLNPGELAVGVLNLGATVQVEYEYHMVAATAGVLLNSILWVPDFVGLGTEHITVRRDLSIVPFVGAGVAFDTKNGSDRFYLGSLFDLHTVREQLHIDELGISADYRYSDWIWRPGLLYASHGSPWTFLFFVPFQGWPLDALQQMYLGLGRQIES